MDTEKNEPLRHPQDEHEETPPLLRSWNRIYIAIALYTCVLIVVLYLITVSLNH